MEICKLAVQNPGPCNFPRAFDAHKHLKPCQFRCFSSSDGKIYSSPVANRMFIFGVGFVGKFFAAQLKKEGWDISGTCQSITKKKELENMGLETYLFNAESEDFKCLTSLQDTSHLLISIPPILGLGDPLLGLHQDLLLSKLSNGNLQWLCYLSTTSVYGDSGGAWVDENYPVRASSESAKASALDTIIKQQPLSKNQRKRDSTNYTSRIHVADICQALTASMNRPSSSGVYNIVDDDPAARAEVFVFAKELVKEKWPSKIAENISSPVATTLQKKDDLKGEKRVCNALMKRALMINLLHPTYRSGLRSIAESLHNPFH
ncbi:uncharacterized protein [Aristolochia californica]|uniref:uncharacterized protein isoform X2 n=1 Tax=Aristolochia californica TaxID=171875 RepID=UPI0035E2847E